VFISNSAASQLSPMTIKICVFSGSSVRTVEGGREDVQAFSPSGALAFHP
jgi:hypothetical protein